MNDYSVIYNYVDKEKYPHAEQMLKDFTEVSYHDFMNRVQKVIEKQPFPQVVRHQLLDTYASVLSIMQHTKDISKYLSEVFEDNPNKILLWCEVYERMLEMK